MIFDETKKVLTSADLLALRAKLVSVKSILEDHMSGSVGASEHKHASISGSGFLTTEQYTNLVTYIPTNIAAAENILKSTIPDGTVLWYYGAPEEIPAGWELVSDHEWSPLYNVCISAEGATLRGIDHASTDENIGDIEFSDEKKSDGDVVRSVALYLIRKKRSQLLEEQIKELYLASKIPATDKENGMSYFDKYDNTTHYRVDDGHYLVPDGLGTYYFTKPNNATLVRLDFLYKTFYFQVPREQIQIKVRRIFSDDLFGKIEITIGDDISYLYNVKTVNNNRAKAIASFGYCKFFWSSEYNLREVMDCKSNSTESIITGSLYNKEVNE